MVDIITMQKKKIPRQLSKHIFCFHFFSSARNETKSMKKIEEMITQSFNIYLNRTHARPAGLLHKTDERMLHVSLLGKLQINIFWPQSPTMNRSSSCHSPVGKKNV